MKYVINTENFQLKMKNIYLLAFLLSCVLLSGCGLDQKGMVMLTDKSYRATVVGTNKDGFTVPDGLLWKQGKLYTADEGGDAVRVWTNASEVKTFCDSSLGIIIAGRFSDGRRGKYLFYR